MASVRYDDIVTTAANNVPFGGKAQVLTIPGAIVQICNFPATGGDTCSNPAAIFADVDLSVPMDNPIVADAQGRFGFWIAPGQYSYTVRDASGNWLGTFPLTLLGGGSFAFATANDFSGVFSEPNTIFMNGFTAADVQRMQGASPSNPNAGALIDALTIGQKGSLTSPTVGQTNGITVAQIGGNNPNVAYYAVQNPQAIGETMWGANFNFGDGGIPTTYFGIELDANFTSASTAGALIFSGSNASNVQPANFGIISVPKMQFYDGTAAHITRWSYLLQSGNGASIEGLILGAQLLTTSPSQTIRLNSINSAGNQVTTTLVNNSAGKLQISPSTGAGGVQLDVGTFVTLQPVVAAFQNQPSPTAPGTTTATGTSGSSNIVVASITGITVGAFITGTGIAPGAAVGLAWNGSSTTIPLVNAAGNPLPNTAAVSGTVTITTALVGLFEHYTSGTGGGFDTRFRGQGGTGNADGHAYIDAADFTVPATTVKTGDLNVVSGGINNTSLNAGIELGSPTTVNIPHIDGHSSGGAEDYSSRIQFSGGTAGTTGSGNIVMTAKAVQFIATPQLTPSTPTTLAQGQIAVDDGFIYVGTSTGIKKVAIA